MLSPQEYELLKELKGNPLWGSIISKLKEKHTIPYKPSTLEGSEKQEKDWIYASGRDFENDRIIFILTGEQNGR